MTKAFCAGVRFCEKSFLVNKRVFSTHSLCLSLCVSQFVVSLSSSDGEAWSEIKRAPNGWP
jgi:hypothetical protein